MVVLRPPDPPLEDAAAGFRLRPWRVADIDPLAMILADDPTVSQWTTVPPRYTREDARLFVRSGPDGWREGETASFCIAALGDDHQILGSIAVMVRPNEIGHVGYWVRSSSRGRGIAGRALVLVSRWGFELGFGRMELQVIVGNGASMRAAEKAGFRREGLLRSSIVQHGRRRDTVMYSLLPEDPLPGDPLRRTRPPP